jgi:hypothetical protein
MLMFTKRIPAAPWAWAGIGGRRGNMVFIRYQVIMIAGNAACTVPLYMNA